MKNQNLKVITLTIQKTLIVMSRTNLINLSQRTQETRKNAKTRNSMLRLIRKLRRNFRRKLMLTLLVEDQKVISIRQRLIKLILMKMLLKYK